MIGIIDGNNFYANCEKAFNPAIKDKPVVIMSNNHGAIIARCELAKALGIDMTQPVFMIKALIKKHGVEGLSSNYTL